MKRFNVTKNPIGKYMFKVSSLKNVDKMVSYFHDGVIQSLGEAVRQMAWLQLRKKPDTQTTDLIVSFLRALTDKKRSK